MDDSTYCIQFSRRVQFYVGLCGTICHGDIPILKGVPMLFFLADGLTMYLVFFLILAVGPAVALMRYTYDLDPIDKEPAGLLTKLILLGVLAAFIAGILESVGMDMFGLLSGLDQRSLGFSLLSDFVVVGVIEEGCKYLLMGHATWNHPAFNCRYDGVVYAVYTSLGFAAMENVQYGLTYGTGVLMSRALMAIPAHMGFAVLFGILYGQAKSLSVRGHGFGAGICIALGYVLSVFLHGLYDSAATLSSYGDEGTFLLVVVAIYAIVFLLVRVAANHDRRFGY